MAGAPKIHEHAPAPAPTPPTPTPTPGAPIVVPPSALLVPAKPDPEIAKQISALAQKARARLEKTPLATGEACGAISATERKRIEKLVRAWLDTKYPGEKLAVTDRDGMEDLLGIGCAEPEGVLVSGAIDRQTRKSERAEVRRNYVVRVSGDHVEVIAERTSTPSIDWMEWADEGGFQAIGTLDVDGDGKRDTLYVDYEHEGGATHSHSSVMVKMADGSVTQLATVTDTPGASVVGGKIVIGAGDDQQHRTFWRCIAKDRQITNCPEAAPFQKYSDKYDAVARLDDTATWTREQLAADFATLGIKGHADLVAAMPERAPEDRLRQHVEQFLIATNQYDPADMRIERKHGEAAQFFAQLASQLGDQPCMPAALTDDVTKAVTKWVERQAHQDMPLVVQPDCGNYVWTTFLKKDGQVEALVTVADGKVTKVLAFEGQMFEGPGTQGLIHQGGFYLHGTTLVGLVYEGTTIHAIANGKAIAKRTGQPRLLDYDTRWTLADDSFDLIVDGTAVIHATPTGLETIDPEPLRPHQIHRAALDRVLDVFIPFDKAYLAALRTLGAPDSLVAEAKARVAASAP